MFAQIGVGETSRKQAEDYQCTEQCEHAGITEAQGWHSLPFDDLRTMHLGERLFGLGMRGDATSPAELQRIVRDDTAKWAKMIKDTGVRVEQ